MDYSLVYHGEYFICFSLRALGALRGKLSGLARFKLRKKYPWGFYPRVKNIDAPAGDYASDWRSLSHNRSTVMSIFSGVS